MRIRIRVDLPAPLAPTRITLDLGGMMQWRLERLREEGLLGV